MLSRRLFLGTAVALAATSGHGQSQTHPELERLRETLGRGGRLGVVGLDTGSGRSVTFDPDSRYAMCSTFKLPLAAFVLRLADQHKLSLSEPLPLSPGRPLDNSPVVEANLGRGSLSMDALVAAIVQRSDNSAANLLMRRTGGPAALTRFIRACGDPATRVDRYEMALNSNIPGDPRDTTTPAAMAGLAGALLTGDILTPSSRQKLVQWLLTSVPQPDRLSAGFPRGWRVGHKPGTGRGGAVNDVAIAWPPGRPPIIVACFISGGNAGREVRTAAHRVVAALVARRIT